MDRVVWSIFTHTINFTEFSVCSLHLLKLVSILSKEKKIVSIYDSIMFRIYKKEINNRKHCFTFFSPMKKIFDVLTYS